MPAKSPLILAIDTGTSSVRCSLWTPAGQPIADSQAQQSLQFDGQGQADAETLRQATERCLDDCLQTVAGRDDVEIVGVGWASFAMSWLGVDSEGAPVTPVYSYADTLSGSHARALRDELKAAGVLRQTYQRTGTPIHTAYAPAQLRYLAETDPARLARVATWQTLSAAMLAHWRGATAGPVSTSEAGWTGLLDRTRNDRDDGLLAVLPVSRGQLPTLGDYTEGVRGSEAAYARRWPQLAEVPFFLAVGDGAAANIGTDCNTPDRIALTIGPAALSAVVVPVQGRDTIDVPQGLWVYPVDEKRRLVGGALTDGGSIYAWMRQNFAPHKDEMLAEAATLAPDSHALTILPFLRSERSPGWATSARMTISGISAETTPAHLLRAAMEAIAYRFALIAHRLTPFMAEGAAIYASGGALHSAPIWRQILADVLNRPVHLTQIDEATSRGVALLAAQALGLVPAALPQPPISHTAHPHAEAHAIYQTAIRRQQTLYTALLGDSAQFE